jgi:hypothetical protein
MKKLYAVFVPIILTCIISISCSTENDALMTVEITEQPVGGAYVSYLACGFRVNLEDINTENIVEPSVILTARWLTDKGIHETSRYDFPTGTSNRKTEIISPEGMYFDKTFWVRLTWKDSEGEHTLESNKASCIVP